MHAVHSASGKRDRENLRSLAAKSEHPTHPTRNAQAAREAVNCVLAVSCPTARPLLLGPWPRRAGSGTA
eukprot:scaffold45043_cov63-Phaeocystis_antarctica.AAC.1